MRVVGSVVEEESGRPLQGLVVRAYDKDILFDDKLGSVQTDANGRFEISYTETQFRDFNETQPDLYLKIFDATGKKLLHSTKKQVRRSAEVLERYEIRIPRAKLA
jgi:5-hydroxyisourate hydrolase-like protein (transthyretin family)